MSQGPSRPAPDGKERMVGWEVKHISQLRQAAARRLEERRCEAHAAAELSACLTEESELLVTCVQDLDVQLHQLQTWSASPGSGPPPPMLTPRFANLLLQSASFASLPSISEATSPSGSYGPTQSLSGSYGPTQSPSGSYGPTQTLDCADSSPPALPPALPPRLPHAPPAVAAGTIQLLSLAAMTDSTMQTDTMLSHASAGTQVHTCEDAAVQAGCATVDAEVQAGQATPATSEAEVQAQASSVDAATLAQPDMCCSSSQTEAPPAEQSGWVRVDSGSQTVAAAEQGSQTVAAAEQDSRVTVDTECQTDGTMTDAAAAAAGARTSASQAATAATTPVTISSPAPLEAYALPQTPVAQRCSSGVADSDGGLMPHTPVVSQQGASVEAGVMPPTTRSLASQLQQALLSAAQHRMRAQELEMTCRQLRAQLSSTQEALRKHLQALPNMGLPHGPVGPLPLACTPLACAPMASTPSAACTPLPCAPLPCATLPCAPVPLAWAPLGAPAVNQPSSVAQAPTAAAASTSATALQPATASRLASGAAAAAAVTAAVDGRDTAAHSDSNVTFAGFPTMPQLAPTTHTTPASTFCSSPRKAAPVRSGSSPVKTTSKVDSAKGVDSPARSLEARDADAGQRDDQAGQRPDEAAGQWSDQAPLGSPVGLQGEGGLKVVAVEGGEGGDASVRDQGVTRV